VSAAHVNIIGRLTADPEQKIPASGNPYTKLRIAWNHKKDEPGYINATLFGKSGEIAAKYLTKGSQLGLMGARLQWSQWEKDGEKRTSYDLVGGDLILLGSKNDEQQAPKQSNLSDDSDIPF
jgi:single-strand DNA-binding protein